MSGAGGGGNYPGGTSDPSLPCNELSFETNLASPVEAIVNQLRQEDTLDVILEPGARQRVVTRFRGEDAGSIVERLPDLIRCIQSGTNFRAIVMTTDDGLVRVEVQPV